MSYIDIILFGQQGIQVILLMSNGRIAKILKYISLLLNIVALLLQVQEFFNYWDKLKGIPNDFQEYSTFEEVNYQRKEECYFIRKYRTTLPQEEELDFKDCMKCNQSSIPLELIPFMGYCVFSFLLDIYLEHKQCCCKFRIMNIFSFIIGGMFSQLFAAFTNQYDFDSNTCIKRQLQLTQMGVVYGCGIFLAVIIYYCYTKNQSYILHLTAPVTIAADFAMTQLFQEQGNTIGVIMQIIIGISRLCSYYYLFKAFRQVFMNGGQVAPV